MIGYGGGFGGDDGTPGLWEKVWLPVGRRIRQLLTSFIRKN